MESRELADRVLTLVKDRDDAALFALFGEGMKTSVPPEKIRDVWARTEVNGKLLGSGEPVVRSQAGGTDLFDYPLKYEKRRQHLQVAVREGLVVGLLERPGDPTGRWNRSRGMLRQLFLPWSR